MISSSTKFNIDLDISGRSGTHLDSALYDILKTQDSLDSSVNPQLLHL